MAREKGWGCLTCGTEDRVVLRPRGYFALEVFLWLLYLLPGLLYSMWRVSTKYRACSVCGSEDVVPLTSPKWRANGGNGSTPRVVIDIPDAPRRQRKGRRGTVRRSYRLPVSLPRGFVIADVETTGLDAARHEIIELSAIRVPGPGQTIETFSEFVLPSKNVPQEITKLTGITNEMVADAGTVEDVIPEWLSFTMGLPLVFYNAPFDVRFLSAAAEVCGYDIRNEVICALAMARRAFPGLASYRLVDVANWLGAPADEAHRALADCRMTLSVFAAAGAELTKQGIIAPVPSAG